MWGNWVRISPTVKSSASAQQYSVLNHKSSATDLKPQPNDSADLHPLWQPRLGCKQGQVDQDTLLQWVPIYFIRGPFSKNYQAYKLAVTKNFAKLRLHLSMLLNYISMWYYVTCQIPSARMDPRLGTTALVGWNVMWMTFITIVSHTWQSRCITRLHVSHASIWDMLSLCPFLHCGLSLAFASSKPSELQHIKMVIFQKQGTLILQHQQVPKQRARLVGE